MMALQARLMVGVQGAGLQWAVFMPEGSVLLEVAWPHKKWPFFFKRYVTPYGIHHVRLQTRDVVVNWTSYEDEVRRGRPLGEEEKAHKLRGSGFKNNFDNLWKWADVKVNVTAFKDAIRAFATTTTTTTKTSTTTVIIKTTSTTTTTTSTTSTTKSTTTTTSSTTKTTTTTTSPSVETLRR